KLKTGYGGGNLLEFRPGPLPTPRIGRLQLAGGWGGSAGGPPGYAAPRVTGSLGVRRYRPHFDLWTIWGAFSPVPYTAVQAQVSVRALPQVQLRARGERYRFSDAAVSTPLVSVEQSGWRGELGM